MSQVQSAIQMLEMALPGLPTGTDPHQAVLKAIQSLSKIAPASEAIPGVQNTQLMQMQQQSGQDSVLQALGRAMGNGPAVSPIAPMGGPSPDGQ